MVKETKLRNELEKIIARRVAPRQKIWLKHKFGLFSINKYQPTAATF